MTFDDGYIFEEVRQAPLPNSSPDDATALCLLLHSLGFGAAAAEATACFSPTGSRTHHHKIKSRTCRLQAAALLLQTMPIIAFQSKLKTCLDFKQVFGTRQHHVLTLLAIDHYYNEQKHAQRSIVDKLEEQHMSKGNNFLIQEE